MSKENRITTIEKFEQTDLSGKMCVYYNLSLSNFHGCFTSLYRVPEKSIDGTPAVGRELKKISGASWNGNGYVWRVSGSWGYNFIQSIKRRFDYTPIDVKGPTPEYYVYEPDNRRFLGYKVIVTYKNNRQKTFFFAHDIDHLGLFSAKRALDRAKKFYEKKCKQMQR